MKTKEELRNHLLVELLLEHGENSYVIEFENTGDSPLQKFNELTNVYVNVKPGLEELIEILDELGFIHADTDEDYLYGTSLELHRFQPKVQVHFPRG